MGHRAPNVESDQCWFMFGQVRVSVMVYFEVTQYLERQPESDRRSGVNDITTKLQNQSLSVFVSYFSPKEQAGFS